MHHYYQNRGLDALDIITKQFANYDWMAPDFICDEVLDKIKENVKGEIEYYQINSDFSFATKNLPAKAVCYTIDYFGKETRIYQNASYVTVRDSVWLPAPHSTVLKNEVWFNSLRKIIRGATGSTIISPYRLYTQNEVPGPFNHPSLTWKEVETRWDNFNLAKDLLGSWGITGFIPQFPTVYPFRLKNRDKVLEKLDFQLPGMWKNKYSLQSPLYKELTLLPIDSRFDHKELERRIKEIKRLAC